MTDAAVPNVEAIDDGSEARRPDPRARSWSRTEFLAGQIRLLQPFDFLAIAVPGVPPDVLEVAAAEDGGLTVQLALRPLLAPYRQEQEEALRRIGLIGAQGKPAPRVPVADALAAASLVETALAGTLGAADPAALDIRHGSHREEHEAELRMSKLRSRIEPLLAGMLGRSAQMDRDGDYYFEFDSTQVYVAPRAAPGAPPIIRVFAITNVGVNLTPELGLFLSRLNFGLAFGRFALDVEHQAVWFDETLLGEQVSDEELRFTIGIVAETANEWDDRIAQMFGGVTRVGALESQSELSEAPAAKPGQGGYL